ncbi:MAG: hypothetical protein CVU78_07315 [Elusimicrobia bacterium HGW-Elusimicrobia-2]|nr:MAG: hypothetical protein CVU78_07315 [Elusimicrobia bacterium HGW-Elusimicrobia-2]
MSNSVNKTLDSKAKALVPILFQLVDKTRDSLYTGFKLYEKKTEHVFDVDKFNDKGYYEIALFYPHFVDRIAFECMKTDEREFFMEALIKEFCNVMETSIGETGFAENYIKREQEYEKYKMVFLENNMPGSAKYTVLWELGNKISRVLDWKMDILLFTTIYVCFVSYWSMVQEMLLKKDI